MVDDRLLRRLDWLTVAVTVWLLLTLVLASFALMTVDIAVGVLALATVVMTAGVAAVSYSRLVESPSGTE